MVDHVQFNNPPKPKRKPVPTKITDQADEFILYETFFNGWRITVTAVLLPVNLVVAGGAKDSHYIWTFWVAGREPFTVVAMMPEHVQDVKYMLRSFDDDLSIGNIEAIEQLLLPGVAETE